MTYYLRTKDGKTILDCEVTETDIHCSVDLINFTNKLLEYILTFDDYAKVKFFISVIDDLLNIRATYWEQVRGKKTPKELAKLLFNKAAKDLDLRVVTD